MGSGLVLGDCLWGLKVNSNPPLRGHELRLKTGKNINNRLNFEFRFKFQIME
jgi:hypothetical protein